MVSDDNNYYIVLNVSYDLITSSKDWIFMHTRNEI